MMKKMLLTSWILLISAGVLGATTETRTIEFDTTQVTQPDMAVTPDGKTLVFSMLGHLFRLPVEGGTAEQLTFGPYYDTDHAVSPDGSRVAFLSDRDGSAGNIFILDLASKRISPLTKEKRAGRPAWSPNGESVVFLSYHRVGRSSVSAVVRRIPVKGGEAETVSSPERNFRAIFYWPDGRLCWTVAEYDGKTSKPVARVEVVNSRGMAEVLAVLEGSADRVAAASGGNGLYFRRPALSGMGQLQDEFVFQPVSAGAERVIMPASTASGTARPRFAVAPDNTALYFGQAGRLWKVLLPGGARLPIPMHAHVKLEAESITPPPAIQVRSSTEPRWIMTPRLTPDGKTLIFGAAGFLWRQALAGGAPAERISAGDVYEDGPALSPDGSRLVFVRMRGIQSSLVLYDLKTRRERTVASGTSCFEPDWSRDGKTLVLGEIGDSGNRIVTLSLADGQKRPHIEFGMWSPTPTFSADGRWLYYSSDKSGIGELYRLSLTEKGKEEMITRLSRHLSDGRISPDGKWLAFRRNKEIWIAALGKPPITDDQTRQFSPEGGDSFVFTADSSALIYSAGPHVWRHPVAGGERKRIPVRIELNHPTPEPLLLRNVRVLDFRSGGFGAPMSMFLEKGRIAWIGGESAHGVLSPVKVIDCAGKFAIPGLFDFHVHADRVNEASFIAYGVTSARDVGGSISWFNAARDRGESAANPIPRFFFSGEIFEGEYPAWGDGFLQICDEASAREYVRRFKEWGADFIKIYPSLPWPLQQAVVDEARRLGLPVAAHAVTTEGITKSITWGCFSIEHSHSEHEHGDVLRMYAKSGTHWDPTLAVNGADALLLRDQPERLSDPKFRAFTPEQNIQEALFGSYQRNVGDATLRGNVANLLARVGEAYRLGVKLNAGTDPSNPECFYGPSLHWELARFVQAGLVPLEVLRMATEEAAAAVGAADLGTLAPGKLADIVLLSADPLQDIHNTEAIWRVIKGGWLFDPDKLGAAEAKAKAGK